MGTVTKLLALAMVLALFGRGVCAQDEAVAVAAGDTEEQVNEKDIQNKLLPLTEMETAFKKALSLRNRLAQYVRIQEEELKKATDDEVKKETRKNIGTARKRLETLNVAMEVVFGIGGRRAYNYDEVNSTIYLRVGTVEEVFVRAIKARDLYAKYIAEQQEAVKIEDDADKKKEIEGKIETATRRYQLVAASLYQIYGVTTKRSYSYNPKNSTLYLKVSENEVEKLRAELKAKEEEAAAAKAAAEQE